MRELKFRAWDKQQKKIIVVPHLSFGDDGTALTIMIWDKTAEMYDRALVVGETAELMQCTGLHDKDGREIYEGDILESAAVMGRSYRYVVTWDDGKGEQLGNQVGWILKDDWHAMPLEAYVSPYEPAEREYVNMEVVGNIYEHPELLQEEQINVRRK